MTRAGPSGDGPTSGWRRSRSRTRRRLPACLRRASLSGCPELFSSRFPPVRLTAHRRPTRPAAPARGVQETHADLSNCFATRLSLTPRYASVGVVGSPRPDWRRVRKGGSDEGQDEYQGRQAGYQPQHHGAVTAGVRGSKEPSWPRTPFSVSLMTPFPQTLGHLLADRGRVITVGMAL